MFRVLSHVIGVILLLVGVPAMLGVQNFQITTTNCKKQYFVFLHHNL